MTLLKNVSMLQGGILANSINTVIFDLDGTLVDSQPAALGASIQALSRLGVQVTEADLREESL